MAFALLYLSCHLTELCCQFKTHHGGFRPNETNRQPAEQMHVQPHCIDIYSALYLFYESLWGRKKRFPSFVGLILRMTTIPFGSPCVTFQTVFSSLIFSTGLKAVATRERKAIMKRKKVRGKRQVGKQRESLKERKKHKHKWRMKNMSYNNVFQSFLVLGT